MTPAPSDPLAVRRRFASHLVGEGIEIGPGHVPFPLPPGVNVRYVERWAPAQNSSLFPELGESPGFPEPDIVGDLGDIGLGPFAQQSQDFVIASHILEHLPNPLAMIVEIHRVLKDEGLLILVLPDRHKTFDRERQPTPLPHLVDEYRRDVREVDDAHILDQIAGACRASGEPFDPSAITPELIALQRRRSVHAHVWDFEEFKDVLRYGSTELGAHWRVIDTMESGEAGTHGDEFGWLLARCTTLHGRRLFIRRSRLGDRRGSPAIFGL